ncbi:MAG: WD40/YVTN/BNR-like repeat-containing protein, partial [Chloroflexota bacterium]
MVVATDRLLYIGTERGLFEATPRGDSYEVTRLPLETQGVMRTPIVVDRDDPRRLYAGTTKDGMLVSEDAGRSWREINRGLIYKEVWSIVQHPVTGEIYVGTGPASVFKSTDRGESWQDAEQFRTMPESIDWTFPRTPHVAHV